MVRKKSKVDESKLTPEQRTLLAFRRECAAAANKARAAGETYVSKAAINKKKKSLERLRVLEAETKAARKRSYSHTLIICFFSM